MKIALLQQPASADLPANLERAIAATRRAAAQGAELVAFSELALTPFYPQQVASGAPEPQGQARSASGTWR